LEAKGTITTEQFDSILEKGPEFAYDLFDSFGLMDGLYKYQIQLAKHKTRVLHDRLIQIYDLPEQKFYSYEEDDDIIVEDSLLQIFKLAEANTGNEGPYIIRKDLPAVKKIAGIPCYSAELEIGLRDEPTIKIRVWYSENLPAYQVANLPFLSVIDGAVLGIEFFPKELPDFGYFATAVEEIPYAAETFQLPAGVEVVKMENSLSLAYEQGDLSVFEESFPLRSGAYYFLDENNSEGNIFGIKGRDDKVLLEAKYYSLEQVNHNCALVTDTDNKFWIINNHGEFLIPEHMDSMYPLSSDRLIFNKAGKSGILSTEGRVLIQDLDEIDHLTEHYLIFKKGDKFGVIDEDGELKLAPTLESITFNRENYGDEQTLMVKAPGEKEHQVSIENFLKKYIKH